MSVGSPATYLVWAILSVIFLITLFTHLWTYDRFQCIKWNNGRQQGAFKRLMTYSYLGNVPLLVVFSVGMARVKYHEGFSMSPQGEIVPTPWVQWSQNSQRWLLPLYFCLSTAWALEIVTHLEELTFWLFLLHQGASPRQWFRSWEFRMWYIGSTMAIIGMPLTTLLARQELSTTMAWIFLVGSSASTCTTICFFYVLARFPLFIEHVKDEGVDPGVVVRLITFYQLNRIRVVFRFIFTIPFIILAADGIQGPYRISNNLFAVDMLLMLGALGSFVSSGITLFVFFPRSIAEEAGYRVLERLPESPIQSAHAQIPHSIHNQQVPKSDIGTPDYDGTVYMRQIDSRPMSRSASRYSYSMDSVPNDPTPGYDTETESIQARSQLSYLSQVSRVVPKRRSMPSRDSGMQTDEAGLGHPRYMARRHSDGGNLHGKVTNVMPLHQANMSTIERRSSRLDRYLLNFTSPIDLPDDDNSDEHPPAQRHRAPP